MSFPCPGEVRVSLGSDKSLSRFNRPGGQSVQCHRAEMLRKTPAMRVERLPGSDNRPGPLRSARAAHDSTRPPPPPPPTHTGPGAQDEVKGAQRRAGPPAARHSPPEPARPGDRPQRPRRVVLGPRLQGALRLFPPSSRPRPRFPNPVPFVERNSENFLQEQTLTSSRRHNPQFLSPEPATVL